MDGQEIERRLREFFVERAAAEGIAAAWLFGSVARGTARPDSDVDVGVLFTQDPPRTLEGCRFDLEADLERLLRVPTQLVVLNHVSPELAVHVFGKGKLLVEQDRSKRVEFEVRSRFAYWDLEPYIRLWRKMEVQPR